MSELVELVFARTDRWPPVAYALSSPAASRRHDRSLRIHLGSGRLPVNYIVMPDTQNRHLFSQRNALFMFRG
jgi:hypothetical protein